MRTEKEIQAVIACECGTQRPEHAWLRPQPRDYVEAARRHFDVLDRKTRLWSDGDRQRALDALTERLSIPHHWQPTERSGS